MRCGMPSAARLAGIQMLERRRPRALAGARTRRRVDFVNFRR